MGSSRRPPSMSHGRRVLNRASWTPPARVPASPAPSAPSPETGAGQMALRQGPRRVPAVPTTCIPWTYHRVGESPRIIPRCTTRPARRDAPGAHRAHCPGCLADRTPLLHVPGGGHSRGPRRVPAVPITCIPRTYHRVGESPRIIPRCTTRPARRDAPGSRTCGETHGAPTPALVCHVGGRCRQVDVVVLGEGLA